MGKKARQRLERKKLKEHCMPKVVEKISYDMPDLMEEVPTLNLHRDKVDEPGSLESCLVAHTVWFAIMMLKIYVAAHEKQFQFPGFWKLMYIWDDYIPIVYIFGISFLPKYVTLNHYYLSGVIVFGCLPPVANSLWYLVKLDQHNVEFDFPLWKDYPLGILWWICLTICHILRCKTIHAFVGVLPTWILHPHNYSLHT